ncbi:MAG: metallophosphoesterase [Firmicutes bacterium]|nr:metallophosphoesterase [Bacillota bacterium]
MKNKYLTLLFLMCVILFLYSQNNFIQITHYQITNDKIPNNFDGYKIIQISDYHNVKSKILNKKLINNIKKINPDSIVITGDLVDATNTDINQAIKFIQELKDFPVYYVTGNHETWINNYELLKINLIKNNITILENDVVTIEKENQTINLIGIDDSVSKNNALDKIDNIEYNPKKYNILLSHRPELFDVYIEKNIDLALTGHAHGGQVRIPFIGGLIAPEQGLLPKYTSGIHKDSNTTMIVNRGIGNSVIPLRINNHPELVLITLNK